MRSSTNLVSVVAVVVAGVLPQVADSQPARTLEELERRVKAVLLNIDSIRNKPQVLEQLAAKSEVSAVLLRILEQTKGEVRNELRGTMGYSMRMEAIPVLAAFGERRAIPILKEILLDRRQDQEVKIRCSRALGRLDLAGNKDILLRVFDETPAAEWRVHMAIAEALIDAKDRAVIARMEAWARGERLPNRRARFEKIIAEMKNRLPPL